LIRVIFVGLIILFVKAFLLPFFGVEFIFKTATKTIDRDLASQFLIGFYFL